MGAHRPFAIYYGWPSDVNDARGDVRKAIGAFVGYEVVVFGSDCVLSSADPHSQAIIVGTAAAGVVPYGYVSLGVTHGGPHLSLAELDNLLDRWKAIGAQGMFLDCAGADYGVSRSRFDAVVICAHSLGMMVIANAWDPDDVLAGSTTMGPGDGYLGENDVLSNGEFLSPTSYTPKLATMLAHKTSLGINLYETGTTTSFADAAQLTARVNQALAPYGVDSFQLTDPQYSSHTNVLVAPAER